MLQNQSTILFALWTSYAETHNRSRTPPNEKGSVGQIVRGHRHYFHLKGGGSRSPTIQKNSIRGFRKPVLQPYLAPVVHATCQPKEASKTPQAVHAPDAIVSSAAPPQPRTWVHLAWAPEPGSCCARDFVVERS